MIEPSTGVSPDLISELIFFFLLYWEVRLNWPSESLFSPSLTQLYCLEFVAELEGTISEGGDEAFFKETLCSCCMCFCSYICRILLHSCRKEICHALDTKRINFKRHSTYLLRTWNRCIWIQWQWKITYSGNNGKCRGGHLNHPQTSGKVHVGWAKVQRLSTSFLGKQAVLRQF